MRFVANLLTHKIWKIVCDIHFVMSRTLALLFTLQSWSLFQTHIYTVPLTLKAHTGAHFFSTLSRTQQNSYSISHLHGTVTTQWLDSNSLVTIVKSWQHGDYTVDQLCSHRAADSWCSLCDWWNRSFAVYVTLAIAHIYVAYISFVIFPCTPSSYLSPAHSPYQHTHTGAHSVSTLSNMYHWLHREIVPPRETVAIATVAIATVGRGGWGSLPYTVANENQMKV